MLKTGDLVILKVKVPEYSITNEYAVCKVLSVSGKTMNVKVAKILNKEKFYDRATFNGFATREEVDLWVKHYDYEVYVEYFKKFDGIYWD